MSPRCLDRGRLQLKANPLQAIHVPGETDSPCGGERRDQIGACFSLLSHTACSCGHRPKWRCPAAASRMPQGRNARARQGAPGGAVERGRERRLGLTSLYCDPSDISGEARRAWEAEWEWRGAAADPEKLSGGNQSLQAVSAWAFPDGENGSSLSEHLLFSIVSLLLRHFLKARGSEMDP